MIKKNNQKTEKPEKIYVEGIKSVVEGETVYRRTDGKELMVTGVRCAYVDKYDNKKVEYFSFIELGK